MLVQARVTLGLIKRIAGWSRNFGTRATGAPKLIFVDSGDHNKVEVDAVLENRKGRAVGIEVKAASTVRSDDFNGLRRLAEKLGDDFLLGVVLYTGATTLPFGPKLRAVPVSALWHLG